MSAEECTQNWPEVEERLAELMVTKTTPYKKMFVIEPLNDRYNSGERSRALAEEVMAVTP